MGDHDTTPTEGATVSRRTRAYQGMLIPFGAIAAVVIAFAVFLFNRIEAVKADLTARMDTGRAERTAQVSAIERDVVRLQDQQASTIAVMAEIKSDMREILVKLDRIERKQP